MLNNFNTLASKALGFRSFLEPMCIVRSILNTENTEQFRALLIFKSTRQKIWLLVNDRSFFCVLDDITKAKPSLLLKTRKEKLIEDDYKTGYHADVSINKDFKKRTGLLTINGFRKPLYYSKALFPNPKTLQEKIDALVLDKEGEFAI